MRSFVSASAEVVWRMEKPPMWPGEAGPAIDVRLAGRQEVLQLATALTALSREARPRP